MKESKGYYSLIQYCPDLARLEAATIGVLLFCPERKFLKAKVARDNRRIIHFFGKGHDWEQINSFKQGIEDRLARECESIKRLEDLELFIAQRANLMQITSPRPMRVGEPEQELSELFSELIGPSGKSLQAKGRTLTRRVWAEIEKADLTKKVRRNVEVTIPALDRAVSMPFGFQNGRLNLIKPMLFPESEEAIDNRVCRLAIEGESLYGHVDESLGKTKLVVLGRFARRNASAEKVVVSLLEKKNTDYVRWADRESLWEMIKTTGKELPV